MFQINCLNPISKVGLDRLTADYKVTDNINDAEGVLVRSASMHELELPENLLAVARAGAGVNNIPLDKCAQKGIVVFNTPGANANGVKELVIAGMLLAARDVVGGIEWVKASKDNADIAKAAEKEKKKFAGCELMGKKLGIIGLGAIGIQVANVAECLGMDVYGYDPYISVDAAWKLSRAVKHAATLDDIYANCDYITLHVPLTDETRGFINAETIAKMKNSVRILNFARGDLVNTEDIINALADGKVAAYATDFLKDELIDATGVITIPHLGASTPESEDNCAVMAVDELKDYIENGNITNSVNMPAVSVPRSGKTRITIIHKNVPNVISRITAIVAEENINIDNMVNKSRGEYAYTMLDTDTEVSNDAITAISSQDFAIRVRVIK